VKKVIERLGVQIAAMEERKAGSAVVELQKGADVDAALKMIEVRYICPILYP
jgi:hypothetical protein